MPSHFSELRALRQLLQPARGKRSMITRQELSCRRAGHLKAVHWVCGESSWDSGFNPFGT